MSGPITKKFGKEPVNYYSGNPLNRLSFLRENYEFLRKAILSPNAKFLPLNSKNPLLYKFDKEERPSPEISHKLHYLSYSDVRSLVNVGDSDDLYSLSEDETVNNWSSTRDRIGINRVLVVFLGVDESIPGVAHSHYNGQAYFAVDLTPHHFLSDKIRDRCNALTESLTEDAHYLWASMRMGPRVKLAEFAIYGQAVMYLDWNARNRFCGGCGRPTISVNGGCKLLCPATDDGKELPPCETRGVVSNLSFPRTDSSIIVAVLNYTGDRILLGRAKRFPPGMYSCLAGFLEPAEGLEDCVRREVYEESGVNVGRVVIYSSQPWPYPANIMVGCIAEVADASEESHNIHLGHDPELADARWFTFDEVRKILEEAQKPGYNLFEDTGKLRIPPRQAIANVLIDAATSPGFSLKDFKI
jgi:NAD+ diphosphatase